MIHQDIPSLDQYEKTINKFLVPYLKNYHMVIYMGSSSEIPKMIVCKILKEGDYIICYDIIIQYNTYNHFLNNEIILTKKYLNVIDGYLSFPEHETKEKNITYFTHKFLKPIIDNHIKEPLTTHLISLSKRFHLTKRYYTLIDLDPKNCHILTLIT